MFSCLYKIKFKPNSELPLQSAGFVYHTAPKEQSDHQGCSNLAVLTEQLSDTYCVTLVCILNVCVYVRSESDQYMSASLNGFRFF